MRNLRCRKYISLSVLLAALFGVTPSARGQVADVHQSSKPDPAQKSVMGMDTLVRIGLSQNLEIIAMRAEVDAATARARQARLIPNPMVEVQRTQSRDGMDRGVMVEGSLPIEVMGTRSARIAIAKRELELKNIALRTAERDLAVKIRKAFAALAAARRKVELVTDSVRSAEASLELTRQAVAAGKEAPLTETREAVEVNKLKAMKESAFGEQAGAEFELKNMLGIPPEEVLTIEPETAIAADLLLSTAGASNQALVNRPELQGARIIVTLAESRVALARAEGRPEVELAVGYEQSMSGFPLRAFSQAGILGPIEKEMKMFSFGLKISVPVINRNGGEIAAIEAERLAAEKRLAFGELAVRSEVASSEQALRRAFAAVEIMRVGVLEQSRRNLEVVRQSYELGALSLTEYLREQRMQVETEAAYIDSRRAATDAATDFLRAIGSEKLYGR